VILVAEKDFWHPRRQGLCKVLVGSGVTCFRRLNSPWSPRLHPLWTSGIEGLETSSSMSSSNRLAGTELASSVAHWEYFPVWTLHHQSIWIAKTSYRQQIVTLAAQLHNRCGQVIHATFECWAPHQAIGTHFQEQSPQTDGVISFVNRHEFVHCDGW